MWHYNQYLVKACPTPLTRPLNAGSGFDFQTFSFRCVTPKEVFDSIYHIKFDLVGPNGVPLKFVKLLNGSALSLITYIFNFKLCLVVFLLSENCENSGSTAIKGLQANKYTALAVQGPGICNA
jgi:hypothetical protein